MTICKTPQEAWRAGWEEPCEHGADLAECPKCAPTDEEIALLAPLLRPYLACGVSPRKAPVSEGSAPAEPR